jgi:hypothetical protein
MIIGLTGKAGVGKDTVANYLVQEYGFHIVRLADPVREALYTLNPIVAVGRVQDYVDEYGWDTAKRKFPEIRRLMQVFATEVVRDMWGEDIWISMAMDKINKLDAYRDDYRVVIPDVRFQNEAYILTELNPAILIEIERSVSENLGDNGYHSSELGIDKDFNRLYIPNHRSIEELYNTVDMLMHGLKIERVNKDV